MTTNDEGLRDAVEAGEPGAAELLKVIGQLAALQQANATLIEKWRIRGHDVADQCADELEASTDEATT